MCPCVTIESLDQEGRGVARIDGKAVFVEGALPGERVRIDIVKRKPSFDVARLVAIEKANASRVEPACPHFGVCGGCSLQHADPALQLAAKQRTLEDALQRIGRVTPEMLLPPIEGTPWRYRYRARLSVRHVPKKGGVLVGFHERKSSYVADMRECRVLPKRISDLLMPLRALVASLSIRDRLPQIEVAVGERLPAIQGAPAATIYALVLRVLNAPSADDEAKLVAFADAHGVELWLQPGGPDTVAPFHPRNATLAYTLPDFDIAIPFAPTDFTQVNAAVNRVLVRRAVTLLDPQPGERIADFFCGLGNFALAIARRGARVVGVDGNAALAKRAAMNAKRNALHERATFVVANLFSVTPQTIAEWGRFDRILIDPPREGAVALAKALSHAREGGPRRIVYVSCNAATLARDAAVLVHERGYRLRAAGIVNMFPHTAHVESIAVFEAANA